MPEVSRFYGEHEVLVNITTLAILRGSLPARALGMVTEWAALHTSMTASLPRRRT